MFFRSTVTQTVFMLRQKGAITAFYILLFLALRNFIGNVIEFQGTDVSRMYQPMKLLMLSYNRAYYNADMASLFAQIFPILVVCPAGFALAKEYQLGTDVLLAARLGRRLYCLSKLAAAFCATFVVITLPFLLEIVLNCISFPLAAAGDMLNWGYYDSQYVNAVHNYYMYELFLRSPYLYAVVGTLLFGTVSGILGAFTMAVSSVVKIKYNVFLFLPVFLLTNATLMLNAKRPPEAVSFNWYENLMLFSDEPKNIWLPVGFFAVLAVFTVCAVLADGRKDSL